MLYLTRDDVESVGVTMREIVTALGHMFVEKGKGNAEMPPKPGIHPRQDAFIHAMPGYLPGIRAAGMKWVSGYPENRERGLPYISGLIVLNDPDTGIPLAVMDATWVTAVRTGAATAVAARYLARPDSTTVGIIACGVQGRTNLEALTCVFEITHVRAFDTNREAAQRFAREMHRDLALDVTVVDTPKQAVRDSDLVVTSGPILKDPSPTIAAGWLAPGAFACPVDFDSYWQGAALREADKLATDDRGQLEYYRSTGYFQSTPTPYADLGEIATGSMPGRETEHERIICINLGLALEDMATARLIYDRAREKGIGRELPL
ncbi:MAG: ornithine cyclodeaminase family protein [Gemmatimonadota bacterium]